MNDPAPREQLDPRARTLWRVTGLLQALFITAPVVAGAILLLWLDRLPRLLVIGPAALVVAAMAFGVWPYPDLLWRQWRYQIGETEVQVQHGWWTVTRTIIPIARIQHVDTRHDPFQRAFGLATVVLYTAAGSNEIPALAHAVAAAVRDRIAALAHLADDV